MSTNAVSQKISQEELYLNHLGGVDAAPSPIGKYDYDAAKKASPHPMYNQISSIFKGGIKGSSLAIAGFLAAPLLSSDFRAAFFGTIDDLTGGMLPLMHKLKNANQNPYDYYTYDRYGKEHYDPDTFARENPENINRLSYYVHVLWDNVLSHPLVITGAALATLGTCVYFSKANLEKKEAEAGKELIQNLKSRYQKIAEKLEGRKWIAINDPSQKAALRNLAAQILSRKVEIDSEVDALRIPQLKHAREVTEPVYQQANSILKTLKV